MKSGIRWLLTALSLAGAFWIIREQQSAFSSLQILSVAAISGLILLHILTYVVIGYSHQAFLRNFSVRLRAVEWIGLSFIVNFYNLFLPAQGGTVLRSIYLKKQHGLPYSHFLLGTAFLLCVSVTMMGMIGTTINGLYWLDSGRFIALFSLPFAGVGILGAALLAVPRLLRPAAAKWNWPSDWLTRWHGFFAAPILARVLAAYLAFCVVYVLRVALSFAALGMEVRPLEAALAAIVILALTAINFTPGNLGVRETALALIMSQFGYSPAQVVVATLVDRALQLVVLVPCGLVFQQSLAAGAGVADLALESKAEISRH